MKFYTVEKAKRGPYWITTHYGAKCATCGFGIKKGETALYFPETKKVLCAGDGCGKAHERQARERKAEHALYGYHPL